MGVPQSDRERALRVVERIFKLHDGVENWEPVSVDDARWVLQSAQGLLQKQDNVLEVSTEDTGLVVFGDVHGQLFDVLARLDRMGRPDQTPARYLFNGDLVDRGAFGVELALLAFAYTVACEGQVIITRGNHESRAMTQRYGFRQECIQKYGRATYEAFMTTFDALPLAAVVSHGEKRLLVLHGGLFTDPDASLEDLALVDRFQEPPHRGVMHDALWSDPGEDAGRSLNTARGGGLKFGPDVTREFLQANQLDMIVRSHEVRERGYSVEHGGLLLTVFSAPRYCGLPNRAAVLILSQGESKIVLATFDGSPAPETLAQYYLQSKM